MDFNPITKPQRLVIRRNHIHALFHHPFRPLMVHA